MIISKNIHIALPILNFFIQTLNINNLNQVKFEVFTNRSNSQVSQFIRIGANPTTLRSKISFGIKSKSSEKEIKRIARTLSKEEMDAMPKQRTQKATSYISENKKDKFFSNLINNYFTEKILIYRRNSGILTNNLKKDELLYVKEKEQRRSTRERFKRALRTEQIHFQFPKQKKGRKGESAILINWRRIPVWSSPEEIIRKVLFLKNRRSPGFPTANQKLLMEKLDKFPVFTVENNLRQLILAYPPETFIKNYGDKLYDWYYRIFEWEKDTRATTLGFFFFNPEDAKLYEYNIRKFGALSAQDLGVKIRTSRLSIAYKLNRTSPPETRFMLLPDLKEVGDLITTYRHQYGRKMQFHHKQKISKDGFANQPIYIIQNIQIRTGLFSKKTIKYQADLANHYYLFLSLEGAEAAWNIFCKSNPDLRLPKKPNLLVYNFHGFIKDYEQNPDLSYKDFVLAPNRETYELIQKLKINEANKGGLQYFYENKIAPHLFFIKLWINRFRLVLLHAPRINEFPRRELLLPQNQNSAEL